MGFRKKVAGVMLLVVGTLSLAGAASADVLEGPPYNDREVQIRCHNPITGETGGGCVSAGRYGVGAQTNCLGEIH